MQIRFLQSAMALESWPVTGLPEVAIFGRSNAGKSTLINTLASARVARVSRDPGRTRTLNFFDCGDLLLVDLPGYGYAKVSKEQEQRIHALLRRYIERREALRGAIQLVDIRHAPSALDIAWHQELVARGQPLLLLLGKADQVGRGRWKSREQEIVAALGGRTPAVFWSARTGDGKRAVEEFLGRMRQAEPR